ncbi:MAG: L-rhamnose mutarotase, partial [Planctomycetes bacterium]|nr:L-rhamnose mutarotase [Planctomycetota bacterium]
TQHWWQLTEPCQQPLSDRPAGAWWAPMEEVFHLD